MRRLVSRAAALILLVGCHKRTMQGVEGNEIAQDDWPGTKEELALYRALSVKDPEPRCADVEGLVPDPIASLTMIAEDIPMPPWAGTRAATCLVVGHAEEAEDTLRDWVVDEGKAGLARLVLGGVDDIPEEVAVEVVRDALAGPFAAEATEAAQGSERQAIRDLLAE